MRTGFLLVVVLLGLAGCNRKEKSLVYTPPANEKYGADPSDPDLALYEQLRSGSVQMAAVAQTLSEVRDTATGLRGNLGGDAEEALSDILSVLDSVGATVTDLAVDPPTQAQVSRDFAAADDQRKKAIQEGSDAYVELSEAYGMSKSLEEAYPDFIKLSDLLAIAQGDLTEAVQAFGGQIVSVGD
ncbi:MAG: hypothetical protein IT207_09690 [Fimbriimonadaceae bacterium]|nr:hypothetical protein [Fimbriimonadaceae bacterium]